MENVIDYINNHFEVPEDYIEVLNIFRKLIVYMTESRYSLDEDNIFSLINNSKLNDILVVLVNGKSDNQKHLLANYIYTNELAENILLLYCQKNYLDIEDILGEERANKKELLTDEEVKFYIDLWQKEGNLEARSILIEYNDGLVRKVAKKYYGLVRRDEFDDLLQEGRIGLMRAIDKYDYSKGKFSTYAWVWVRQKITLFIANDSKLIRLPRYQVENINRLYRTKMELTKKIDREPTIEELATNSGLKKDLVQELTYLNMEPVSLEKKINDEKSGSTLGDFIIGSNDLEEESIKSVSSTEFLNVMYDILTPREVKILMLRWGLNNTRKMSLPEIGTIIGVSRQRVQQIEEKAIRKLKSPIVAKRLKGERKDNNIFRTLFTVFNQYPKANVIEAINRLPKEDIEIIFKRYGKYYDEFNYISGIDLQKLYMVIFPKMEKILEESMMVEPQSLMNYFKGSDFKDVVEAIEGLNLQGQYMIKKMFGLQLNETKKVTKSEFAKFNKYVMDIKKIMFTKKIKDKVTTIYDLYPEIKREVLLNAIDKIPYNKNKTVYRLFGINLDQLVSISVDEYRYLMISYKNEINQIIAESEKNESNKLNEVKSIPESLFATIKVHPDVVMNGINTILSKDEIEDLYKYYGYNLENPKYMLLTNYFRHYVEKNIILKLKNYLFFNQVQTSKNGVKRLNS